VRPRQLSHAPRDRRSLYSTCGGPSRYV